MFLVFCDNLLCEAHEAGDICQKWVMIDRYPELLPATLQADEERRRRSGKPPKIVKHRHPRLIDVME